MQWVLRANRLECLKAAASISVSVDDRAGFRIVRYRCSFASTADFLKSAQQSQALSGNAPSCLEPKSLQAWADMDPLVHEGGVAVLKPAAGLENTIAKQDADKSQSMADSVLEAFSKACENVEGKIDEDSLANILVKVQHFVADQGTSAQKCGQLLSRHPSLPNLLCVSQDPAHQVRIAAKDPMRASATTGNACLQQNTLWCQTFKAVLYGHPGLQRLKAKFWGGFRHKVAALQKLFEPCHLSQATLR